MASASTTEVAATKTRRRRRLRWLIAIGLALLLLAAAYINFYLYLPMGSGPAGPEVPAEPFARTWSDRKVILIGLGDSITAGLGASRSERSYFHRLVANPPDEFDDMKGKCLSKVLPELSTLNLAVSGSDSSQHLARIEEVLPEQSPDHFGIVVITSGGNDLIHWYGRMTPRENAMYGATLEQAKPWIANYERRLDEILKRIKEKLPGGCLIFLGDIYDPSDGAGDPESVWLPEWPDCVAIHGAYNEAIRRAAGKHAEVRVVPLYKTFLGHGIHCRKFWREHFHWRDPHYWYAFNLEDPNDRGYDAARRAFLLAIADERSRIAVPTSPLSSR